MSTARFVLICFSASFLLTSLPAQLSFPQGTNCGSEFPSPFTMRAHLVTRVISGVVSLRELEHPIPKKAIREAREALRFAYAKNFPKAIAKLENAIRFFPEYRDAHLNLGAVYARTGRFEDARAEFQEALNIGPPAAVTYADLALISVALDRYSEAETFAHKALELDPANSGAKLALQYASQH